MQRFVCSLRSSVVLLALLFFVVPANSFARPSADGIEVARGLSSAFEKVAESITPSVVSISSKKRFKKTNGTSPGSPLPNDQLYEQFKEFFGPDMFGRKSPFGNPGGSIQQGMGTGVIVDESGHILTNNHVIGEADDVTVRLHSGKSYKAEIVGSDPRTDLAVIKIDAPELSPARIGDSEKLKIGEWVVAAGNPFGLDKTITAGIVSAKGRSIMGGGQYEDFIQTDAAINPGNSGGPLVNLNGEVVGINTAIFSRSGGYMGIGFAIPSAMAKNVMKSLISEGRVVRGWLGVAIQNLDEQLAESFDYPGTEGALVGDIQPDGPAKDAGIQAGDIIVSYQDEKIEDINQLRNSVASTKPGTKAKIVVVRDGRKKTLKLKVGELPTDSEPEEPELEDEPDQALGIIVETLSKDVSRRLGAKTKHGVVVRQVRPGSRAAEQGIRSGDIISRVGRAKITSVDDFREALEDADLEKGVRLSVESKGMSRFVFIKAD